MVFSDLVFLFKFLPAVAAVYYIVPKRIKNFVLFLSSLWFYRFGEPKYIVLIIATIILHYACGLGIEKLIKSRKPKAARLCLIGAVVASIGMLGIFKYTDFVIETVNSVANADISLIGIALPIGISFYTFQSISYTVDVYKGVVSAQKNFIDFGTYISFFPQLIAGPVVQYKTIEKQIKSRPVDFMQIFDGIKRFCIGLGKKVLLANQIGFVWTEVQKMSDISALTAWIGIAAFTFQIYFDFSGYSDMAIGMGKMFGFDFNENFNYPYTAKSITDFWRRWHISLSSWFREYVYIPLGGNRCKKSRWIFNILIVWLLTGLWHGASWNFVLWGVYFGIILLLEKLVLSKIKALNGPLGHIYALALIVFGWVMFSADDLSGALNYFKSMLGMNGLFADSTALYLLRNYFAIIILCTIGSTKIPADLVKKRFDNDKTKRFQAVATSLFCVIVFVLSVAFITGDTYNPFLYFRF